MEVHDEPAAYEVGQSGPGQPAAPTIPVSTPPTSGGRSVLAVGGESSFGLNTAPERSSTITEHRPPASNLPEQLSHAQIADEAASYWDGRCGNVGGSR
jgi:hypothetical protein